MLWLVVLLFLAAYSGVSWLVPQTSLALVILLFLVRQATVLAKVWCRLLFYSAQCALYRDLRPSPVSVEPAPGPEPEPAAPPAVPGQVPPETEPDRPGGAFAES